MNIEKESQLKELYDLNHRHDTNKYCGFDYENKLFEKTMSNVMTRNTNTREFLDKLQEQMVWMIQSTLVLRNYYNHVVNKYYYKHNR